MPRHRVEHEPRHRAPRADRRVPYSAASSRPPSHAKRSTGPGQKAKAVAAIGTGAAGSRRTPSHAKPSTGPGQKGKTVEAISSGTSEQLHTSGTRLRNDQRNLLSGAVRGLIVSPWFAAGAGFVIAAGAFMYAPHASLLLDTAPGRTNCPAAGCPVPQQAPVIAGAQGGLVTASPSPGSSSPRGRHAAPDESDSAPDFSYTVQPDGAGMFQMTFTMTSSQPIGDWRLSFDIPGATDLTVTGASWQPSGTDGGTASGLAAGSTPNSGQTSFVVRGMGEPTAAPDNCSFGGATCHFTEEH
jgi:hypothetical protein